MCEEPESKCLAFEKRKVRFLEIHVRSSTENDCRAVGIIPNAGIKFPRESLEETVLITQKILVL